MANDEERHFLVFSSLSMPPQCPSQKQGRQDTARNLGLDSLYFIMDCSVLLRNTIHNQEESMGLSLASFASRAIFVFDYMS